MLYILAASAASAPAVSPCNKLFFTALLFSYRNGNSYTKIGRSLALHTFGRTDVVIEPINIKASRKSVVNKGERKADLFFHPMHVQLARYAVAIGSLTYFARYECNVRVFFYTEPVIAFSVLIFHTVARAYRAGIYTHIEAGRSEVTLIKNDSAVHFSEYTCRVFAGEFHGVVATYSPSVDTGKCGKT